MLRSDTPLAVAIYLGLILALNLVSAAQSPHHLRCLQRGIGRACHRRAMRREVYSSEAPAGTAETAQPAARSLRRQGGCRRQSD